MVRSLVRHAVEVLGHAGVANLLVRSETEEGPIGELERLAVYLTGTALPRGSNGSSDVNGLGDEFDKRGSELGSVQRCWR